MAHPRIISRVSPPGTDLAQKGTSLDMNNTDFRRLVQDTPRAQNNATPSATFARPTSLGSRKTSNIPMTPRTVRGGPSIDFARQLAEQNGRPSKKFRSSAGPKGTRLGAGYTDRALHRDEQAQDDDRGDRVLALEEQMKLGQIERDVFERLRDQITGGDVDATHLVKGLDRQLLRRVKRGEDVLAGPRAEEGSAQEVKDDERAPDAEDELEELAEREVVPVQRLQVSKKGEMAPPPSPAPVAGQKRTRNDILAEWKAARRAEEEAKLAAQPQLGARFRKLNAKQPQSRVERDDKGREVLITVDEEGRIKRKVRYLQDHATRRVEPLAMPDKAAEVLGIAVPDRAPAVAEEDEDDDIFEGVGDSYDPLGMAEQEDGIDASDEDDEQSRILTSADAPVPPAEDVGKNVVGPESQRAPPKKNYFADGDDEEDTREAVDDDALLAVIKRAAALRPRDSEPGGENGAASKAQSTAAQRLFQRDRDLDDMDMGFGSSRFADEEDAEGAGGKVKLSKWKGNLEADAGEDDDGGEGGKKDKKAGKRNKKRKGDKNSAADVLKVLESRK